MGCKKKKIEDIKKAELMHKAILYFLQSRPIDDIIILFFQARKVKVARVTGEQISLFYFQLQR
jgi:hypothetical protein